MNNPSPLRLKMERVFNRFGLGMRAKLIIIFIFIKVLPLILLALVAWRQAWNLGDEMRTRALELSATALTALKETGDIASRDAVNALDERAREDIERMTTDTARRVADFLYERDKEILFLASVDPSEAFYRSFATRTRPVVKPGPWELSADETRWVPATHPADGKIQESSSEQNARNFHYRQPVVFAYEDRPLFREITYLDLNGRELIKVTTSDVMEPALKDVSKRENTFVKAETYFPELAGLQPGEIYVSDVIGAYVGSKIINFYTPVTAEKRGIPYEPEKSAYAGMENPVGERFQGIVRWATPVVKNGQKVGYVTMALDHQHIMEFTDHLMPTNQRYTELPDASDGNYAFIWDYKGRSICHPRHFSITGYDPATGDPQVPWLEDYIYDDWQASGKPYAEFITDVPTFVDQRRDRKPAKALTDAGFVGLDCRYLNFAPQCTGWFDLTAEGGSGSFDILWSGLWKLTTAAAIPYYTGHYGESPRGFGFVAIGAGLEYFHAPAISMKATIDALFTATDNTMTALTTAAQQAINRNLISTAASLAVSTTIMAVLVIFVAIWMASFFTRSITNLINGISRFRAGERQFRFGAVIKDELGLLADSFDEMADSIVASDQNGLCITDLDTKVIYMNDVSLHILGLTLQNVVGRHYSEFSIFGENTASSPIAALHKNVEPERYFNEALGRYYLGRADYFRDRSGEKIGYLISVSDVTEMALEQERIARQHTILDNIFNASPDIMVLLAADGGILAANYRFASIVGKQPEDIIGFKYEAVMPASLVGSFEAVREKAINERKAQSIETEIVFANGHTETVESVNTPLFDARGAFSAILSVSRDVSTRVEAEQSLRNTQQKLTQAVSDANRANESKSAFLARMSHEIRTPMNAILGMTSIAKRKMADQHFEMTEVRAHIDQIENSSKHLLGLISDILDISKIEAGKIELGSEFFRLDSLIGDVASIIRPRCIEKNIRLVIDEEPMDNYAFQGDALRLRQVLINLLGNAVKFTGFSGAVTLTVKCLGKNGESTHLLFQVSDTGIGIRRDKFNLLFDPFEQANQNISKKYGGTGLGLSISQSIVRLMGGEITVESEEGKGSVFAFDIHLTHGNNEIVESGLHVSNIGFLNGKRMLLVDDVDINRMIVQEMLHDSGLGIDEAVDGQDALDIFKASAPGTYDIVLMDIQMPNLDGYSASMAIRSLDRPDARLVPIVAMTANAFKDDVDKAFNSGMNAHLAKPVEYDALLETLARAMQGNDLIL